MLWHLYHQADNQRGVPAADVGCKKTSYLSALTLGGEWVADYARKEKKINQAEETNFQRETFLAEEIMKLSRGCPTLNQYTPNRKK